MLIDHEVGGVLGHQLGLDPQGLDGTTLLEEDLGLDSLALTEVLLALEDELLISIPDQVQVSLRTLDDLVSVVASQLAGRAGRSG